MDAASEFELVIERRSVVRRVLSWVRSLFAALVTSGAWAPSLQVETAKVVRRRDGEVVARVDNAMVSAGDDHVHEARADLESMTVDEFAEKWITTRRTA